MSFLGDLTSGLGDVASGLGSIPGDVVNGVGGLIGGVPGLVNAAAGRTNYKATGYQVDPSAYSNPYPAGLAAQLYSQGLNPADMRSAPQSVAPRVTPVADAGRSVVTPVADAQRSVVTPVADAQRATFDTNALAPGLGVTAAALDQNQQTRALEGQNLAGLTAAAQGKVPSAAELQLREALDRTQRAGLAAAASARGTAANRVTAQRNAIDANSDAALQESGQAAAQRAQEQATARDQLTNAITNARGQDLQGAQVGLGLTQIGAGVGGAQLQSDTATGLGNLQARTGLSAAQLGSDTQTNLANLSKGVSLSTAQLGSDTQTALGNLSKNTGLSTAQLGASLQTNMNNVNAVLQSRQLDDAAKANYLASALGIDTRTQQGQIALQQIQANIAQWTQTINANVATNNATNTQQFASGIVGGIGGIAAAGIG